MRPGRKAGSRRKPKAGLTPREQAIVDQLVKERKARWYALLALNAWKPSL